MPLIFFAVQSIWFSARGAQKELDEAKLRFAVAEVIFLISLIHYIPDIICTHELIWIEVIK